MQSRERDLRGLERDFIQAVVELENHLLFYRIQISNGLSADAFQIMLCSHFNNTKKNTDFLNFIFPKFHTECHDPYFSK